MALPTTNFWWSWVWSSGGEILTEDRKSLRLTEPSAIEGLDFIRELRFTHEVIPPPGSGADFDRGNIGFYHTAV